MRSELCRSGQTAGASTACSDYPPTSLGARMREPLEDSGAVRESVLAIDHAIVIEADIGAGARRLQHDDG